MRYALKGARPLPKAAARLVIAALTTIGAAACGSSASSTATTPATAGASSPSGAAGVSYAKAQIAEYSSASAGIPAVADVAHPANLKGKTIWYVPVGGSVPIMEVAGSAMASALQRLGARVHTCNGNFLPTTIGSCLSDAASQGAAAVITAFVDYSEVPTAFNKLAAAHIPVVLAAEPKPSGVSSDLGFLSFDALNYKASRLMSDAVIADSGGSASILVIRLTDSSATAADSDQGITELKENCPRCTVHTLDTDTAQISKLSSAVSAQLTQHPDINYVTALDDDVFAVTAGIDSAGLTGKVKIVSEEGETSIVQRVASGSVNVSDVGFSPVYYGWTFADALVRQMSGDAVQSAGVGMIRVFDHQDAAELSITPAAYATTAWYGTSAFETAYLKAWGAS